MTNILKIEVDTTTGFKQSLLELDADPNAERFMLINRYTGKMVYQHYVPAGGLVRVVLELHYASRSSLLVIILDDSGEYNAACMDGVKLEELDPYSDNV
ncbi:hypothetical protein [Shewanella woodyi]|uniref:hypothetical protein n=1 Tax=Shewanella woodyi TaxID=60961 RepID=UPI0007F94E90|nr:hypothetical protein [Shewanella woodyi]